MVSAFLKAVEARLEREREEHVLTTHGKDLSGELDRLLGIQRALNASLCRRRQLREEHRAAVIGLRAEGLKAAAIATQLGISVRRVHDLTPAFEVP